MIKRVALNRRRQLYSAEFEVWPTATGERAQGQLFYDGKLERTFDVAVANDRFNVGIGSSGFRVTFRIYEGAA